MNRSGKLIAIQLPVVVNEILLKLLVRARGFNLMVGLKKCLDAIWISSWLHMATNIVKEELQVQVPLILDYHVVKNRTCHYVVEGLHVPKTSRTSNNCKPSLQNTESFPDVLSACLFEPWQNMILLLFWDNEWSSQMLTTENVCRRQGSSPLCNHGSWLRSCKPEHLH